MKPIKYSERFNNDYEFYLSLSDKDISLPNTLILLNKFIYDKDWLSAKESYYKIDSWICKTVQCSDIDTITKLLKWKSVINFIINQWVEWYSDGVLFPVDIQEECKDYPDWVYKSFNNKISSEDIQHKRYLKMKELCSFI